MLCLRSSSKNTCLLKCLPQLGHSLVNRLQLTAHILHLGRDLGQPLLQLVLLLLQRQALLKYLRVLDHSLDPGGQRRRRYRRPLRNLRLERVLVLLQQLLHALPVFGADQARIEVDHFVLDAPLAQEVLDRGPGRVQSAHESQHRFNNGNSLNVYRFCSARGMLLFRLKNFLIGTYSPGKIANSYQILPNIV